MVGGRHRAPNRELGRHENGSIAEASVFGGLRRAGRFIPNRPCRFPGKSRCRTDVGPSPLFHSHRQGERAPGRHHAARPAALVRLGCIGHRSVRGDHRGADRASGGLDDVKIHPLGRRSATGGGGSSVEPDRGDDSGGAVTVFDPITLTRLGYLAENVSSDDYSRLLLTLIKSAGDDVLNRVDLLEATKRRTRSASVDIPESFSILHRWLGSVGNTDEQRENITFVLTKLIDDAFNLGAFYMAGKEEKELPLDVRSAGQKGGLSKAERDRPAVKALSEALTPIFRTLRDQNPHWLDAALIREATKAYGSRTPVLPKERQLAKYLARLIQEGHVPVGPKRGEPKKVTN